MSGTYSRKISFGGPWISVKPFRAEDSGQTDNSTERDGKGLMDTRKKSAPEHVAAVFAIAYTVEVGVGLNLDNFLDTLIFQFPQPGIGVFPLLDRMAFLQQLGWAEQGAEVFGAEGGVALCGRHRGVQQYVCSG